MYVRSGGLSCRIQVVCTCHDVRTHTESPPLYALTTTSLSSLSSSLSIRLFSATCAPLKCSENKSSESLSSRVCPAQLLLLFFPLRPSVAICPPARSRNISPASGSDCPDRARSRRDKRGFRIDKVKQSRQIRRLKSCGACSTREAEFRFRASSCCSERLKIRALHRCGRERRRLQRLGFVAVAKLRLRGRGRERTAWGAASRQLGRTTCVGGKLPRLWKKSL